MRAHSRVEAVDRVLAVLFVLWTLAQVLLLHDGTPAPAAAAAGALVCAGLAWRRRFPVLIGLGTQAVLSAAQPWVAVPPGPVTLAWFCALYALAVWTSSRWYVAGVLFVLVANGASSITHLTRPGAGLQFGLVAASVMVLLRIAIGGRDRRLSLAERERDVATREAVVLERERIARELHDVVAHHVSTMVMQAGAERRMLGDSQAETREVLGTIERVGRGALTEMRRMVSMLRQDPARDLAPQPTLRDVPELVRQMQAAGLPVELRLTGDPTGLAEGIGLSAYRIVQEALTNALKHPPGARTEVEIDRSSDSLTITVRDDGTGAGAVVEGGGHGLVGMRERVVMYGGTLHAGPAQPAGFAVRVLLPVR